MLTLYSDGIGDLAPLANLTGMRQLNLWDNELGDISVLAGMKDLNLLMLGNNRVRDLAPLAGLTQLESLYLSQLPESGEELALLPRLATLILSEAAAQGAPEQPELYDGYTLIVRGGEGK